VVYCERCRVGGAACGSDWLLNSDAKSRIVTLRFGTGRQKMVLARGRIPPGNHYIIAVWRREALTEGRGGTRGRRSIGQCEHTPRLVSALKGVSISAVAAGHMHSLCVDKEGKLYSFGYGGYHQLGRNSDRCRHASDLNVFALNRCVYAERLC
jgi:alpha-tubulin suppressor-like RCC1 family protein